MSNNISKKINQFNTRWNIQLTDEALLEQFKSRVITVVSNAIGDFILRNSEFQNRFAFLVGCPAAFPSNPGFLEFKYREMNLIPSGFEASQLYKLINDASNILEVVKYLQYLFFTLEEGAFSDPKNERRQRIQDLKSQLKDVFDLSTTLQIQITSNKNGVYLIPKGAKLLDQFLVIDVLDWLDDFPPIKKHFEQALLMYLEKDKLKDRNLIDNLRLTLELLLQQILINKNRIEDQSEPLKNWMTQKGVQQNISLMYGDFLRHKIVKLANDSAKHGDRVWSDPEIEFLIYQTGVFIRFLIEMSKATTETTESVQ